MTTIRDATPDDAAVLSRLLDALGYPGADAFIARRIDQLLAHPDARLLVAEEEGEVLGFIAVHFIPQLALAGDYCRISQLCIGEQARGRGTGALLVAEAERLAQARGCDRIELHSHARRVDAHRFYARLGYVESPKYLEKRLARQG